MYLISTFILLFFFILSCYCILAENDNDEDDEQRIIGFRKCSGPGCPYTASWLAHTNLYRTLGWKTDSTKMETHSFVIFDSARLKFQLEDHNAYYVHHMSHYEHLIHKESGFKIAQNKTAILAEAAYQGECIKTIDKKKLVDFPLGSLAFIPFFSGLPPNVDKNLHVKSIGQGNSLVGPEIKADWVMATVCSTIKYFGEAVIGVANNRDREIIQQRLELLGAWAKRRIHILQLSPAKPSHLPNQLLAWGQTYVKRHNCAIPTHLRYKNPPRRSQILSNIESHGKPLDPYLICSQTKFKNYGRDKPNVVHHQVSGLHKEKIQVWQMQVAAKGHSGFNLNHLAGDVVNTKSSNSNEDIVVEANQMVNPSSPNASIASSHSHRYRDRRRLIDNSTKLYPLPPIGERIAGAGEIELRKMNANITVDETTTSPPPPDTTNVEATATTSSSTSPTSATGTTETVRFGYGRGETSYSHTDIPLQGWPVPIDLVYFSESDQIVKFDDYTTLRALATASNDTTFFVGRRKTKNHKSNPREYMNSLDSWRNCGVPGFSINWPTTAYVRKEKAT